ncbi:MAG TPA: ComEC/Rec2 family competence protein [Patescibacteria group bacterium]|nr:ComEC/Rec2 family competence protein [Patescibacteria group bacterium]
MKTVLFLLSLLLFVRIYSSYTSNTFSNTASKGVEIGFFTNIDNRVDEVFYKTLPADEAALLLGVVLGQKGNFSKNYLNAIQRTGLLHVIAASGMNVSMVTAFLLLFFAGFLKRQYALAVTAIFIVLYCGLAGFQPSIVRAGIMAIFAIGAGMVGRQNTSILALFFAAFLMLFVSPGLLTNIGFQLSFVATLGIILIDPVLKALGKNVIFEDARTTMAAQIATTPILLFYFGSYSPVSIISNLLIFWTIPPLMILGGAGGLLALVSPVLAAPFLWLSLPLLLYFKYVTLFTSSLAFQIELKSIPWEIIAGYYMILLAVILMVYKRKKIAI